MMLTMSSTPELDGLEGTAHRVWPDPEVGPFVVDAGWQMIDGRLQCRELHIVPVDRAEPRPVTGVVLRQLPVSALLDEAIDAQMGLGACRRVLAPKPRKRVVRDDAHFRQVANVYTRANKIRLPPTRAVADAFDVSHSMATKWVSTARSKGLLAKYRKGLAPGPAPTGKEDDSG